MSPARLSATLAAPVLLAACLAVPALAEPGSFGEPKMLIHGNYCGPGNNAPLPPIDALDAACAQHDACTPNGGFPTRACNLRLQRQAELIARDPTQPDDERAMARLIAATAPLIPSEPSPRRVPAAVASRVAPDAYAPGAYAPDPRWSVPGSSYEVDGPDAD